MPDEKTIVYRGREFALETASVQWDFKVGDIITSDTAGPWQNQYVVVEGFSKPKKLWGRILNGDLESSFVESNDGLWLVVRPGYQYCIGDIVQNISNDVEGLDIGRQGRVLVIDPRDWFGDGYYLVEFTGWEGKDNFAQEEMWFPARHKSPAKNRIWRRAIELKMVKSARVQSQNSSVNQPIRATHKSVAEAAPATAPSKAQPIGDPAVTQLWGFRCSDIITHDVRASSPWAEKRVIITGFEKSRILGKLVDDESDRIQFANNRNHLILLERPGLQIGVGQKVISADQKALHYGKRGIVVAIDPEDEQLLLEFDEFFEGGDGGAMKNKPWFPQSLLNASASRVWCRRQAVKAVTDAEYDAGVTGLPRTLDGLLGDERDGTIETAETELKNSRQAEEGSANIEPWLAQLLIQQRSGTAHAFILHGNINDWQQIGKSRYLSLQELLAQALGKRELVMFYDLNHGLTFATELMERHFRANFLHAGGDDGFALQLSAAQRAAKKIQVVVDEQSIEEIIGKAPEKVFPLLDRLLSGKMKKDDRSRCALIIDFAHHLVSAAPSQGQGEKQITEMILQWARSRRMRHSGQLIILITPQLESISAELRADDSGIVPLRIAKPDEGKRSQFFAWCSKRYSFQIGEDMDAGVFGRLTNGLSLVQLEKLCQLSSGQSFVLDAAAIKRQKQEMLESDFGSRLKVKIPQWGFAYFGGRQEIKRYLLEVRDNIAKGILRRVPMGILASGPPGTGKTFIFECWAYECGFNFVEISNPRNMWVGESERWLQEIFSMLDDLSPVIVIEDEADQSEASRDTPNGDSGVSNRLRQMKFTFCSDPKRRGRVIWVRITNRDDLLDAAYKRKGRSDEKIPFILPDAAEYAEIFKVMFARYQIPCSIADFSPFGLETAQRVYCTGADAEWMTLEADRYAARDGSLIVTPKHLIQAIRDWEMDLDPSEVDQQTILAIKGSSKSLRPANWEGLLASAKERCNRRLGLRQPSIYPGLEKDPADSGNQTQVHQPLREQ